ncbi:MAG: ECF-type riboflavin transporter substrate-binding protein [Erysipelotrichaceae bacterium]
MEKKSLFSTKTVVATALGAALFFVLFTYVKIPSPIPNTSIQTAYGVMGLFGALFGPIASGLMAFIGHALSDAMSGYGIWWSWVIASGVAGSIIGLYFFKSKVELGEFGKKQIIEFNVLQVIANVVAWIVVAPVLDIFMMAEPVNLAFTQGVVAAISNSLTLGIIATLLLFAYSKTRTKEGSLTKE